MPEFVFAFDSQKNHIKSILSPGTEIGGVFMILLDYFEEPWLAGKCSGRSVLDSETRRGLETDLDAADS